MKKGLVFTVFVLFVCCTAFSQQYVPFPTENAEWNVRNSTYYYGYDITTYSVGNYSLRGDTLINGILYKKVCKNLGSIDFPQYLGIGGLREEDKKIYYIGGFYGNPYGVRGQKIDKLKECSPSVNTFDNAEMLLYDFNAKIGDIVRMGYYVDELMSIDSVKIGDSFRRRYNFNSEQIIEGIGSVKKGLLGNLIQMTSCGGGSFPEFICFSQNGEILYKNPTYVDCNSTQKWSDRNYFKAGTQWYYGEKFWIAPNHPEYVSYNYHSLKSVGDSTINGIKCNKIIQVRTAPECYAYKPTVFMYQSNDTVYFYNSVSKRFSTLYVFSAKAGDTWTVEYPAGKVQVIVDSVKSLYALLKPLNVQYVKYQYKYVSDNPTTLTSEYNSKIIEGIGDTQYLFMSNIFNLPLCDNLSAEQTGLRCYIHHDYGTYNTGTLACDYVTAILEINQNTAIKVYMTKSGDLKIESELLSNPCIFELLDSSGVLILSAEVNANQNLVKLGNISNGLYIYRLSSNGKLLKTDKIIKL